jgi:hypothetical protein
MKYYFICFVVQTTDEKGIVTQRLDNFATSQDPINIQNFFFTKDTKTIRRIIQHWQEISKQQYFNFFEKRRIDRMQDFKL